MELSQGQAFVFPLSQGVGPVRTDLLIFPHTQLTNMIRIVVVSIDGAFMGGFSDIKVIGCMDTNAPLIEVDSVVTEAATATELVLQKAANTVAEELEAAASASMTSSAVTLETLSEDGSVIGGHHGVGSASMHHHQMHHHSTGRAA